ncbi:alcohol dehydrogenase catalytic domain-containing protein [Altericroceibacterium endophyticum]|uniref:alcohol dehydrogenase catalytic domain-containing protein n=1 Tax=Altericroceibacterium endophyticum TaxID=1808508 RepID=UPI001F4126BD|nr:alcohol dehydrogenase catalytic domain-containing protein [Altericroceibacterium endophyticum]
MSATMMKAIRQHAFGGPDVLVYEDAPRPVLQAGEVLVRVHAIGLNPPDWYLRDGMKILPPEWRPAVQFPIILGTDISGLIAEVGPDVLGFAVGDAVYSMVRFPDGFSNAYAEYVSVPSSDLARKPAGVDHAHAAAALCRCSRRGSFSSRRATMSRTRSSRASMSQSHLRGDVCL